MKAETIRVTILSKGVAFVNGDGLKRLLEVGALRPKLAAKGKVASRRHSELQAYMLNRWPGVRDLAHYRDLVGDPRSEGPMHSFQQGTVLTMERNADPRNSEIPFYVVLDTSIGGSAVFITKLAQARRVRVEELTAEKGGV